MVEEVVDAGLEGVGVEEPAAEGDLYAELVLFIALTVEGEKGGVVGLGELDEGAGCGEQRRRLVEAAVEAAEDPVLDEECGRPRPKRGSVSFSVNCPSKWVWRRPAMRVSQEVALKLSETYSSMTPPEAESGVLKEGVPLPSLKTAPKR